MKIGFQTILWGPRIENLSKALELIASLGFQGVEFGQRPATLGHPKDLLAMLAEHNLELLGLSNGSLQERMQFCHDAFRPLYLYVESCDTDLFRVADNNGFALALHAHVFKRTHSLADAKATLDTFKRLKWIPDSAHQTVAGDDPVEALRIVPPERLAAVHLKDWTPAYGRSCHRYARGFRELGEGELKLDKILQELGSLNYDGWLVVEQDFTRYDPCMSILHNAQWLERRGMLKCHPDKPCEKQRISISTGSLPAAELRFLRTIIQAGDRDPASFYQCLAEAFDALLPSYSVTVWACSPSHDFLSLLAVYPQETVIDSHFLPLAGTLASIAVTRQALTVFDLRDERPGLKWGSPAASFTARELIVPGAKDVIIIPVFSTYNHNHERMIITLIPRCEYPFTEETLFTLGMEAGKIADSVLDDICVVSAARASQVASQSRSVTEFLNKIALLIQEVVACEATSIFLVNAAGDRLEPKICTTIIDWNVPQGQRYYIKGEGLTGRVWGRRDTIITPDARKEPGRIGKSAERVATQQDSCLIVPLLNSAGEVVGVVRCQNKSSARRSIRMFTDEDAAAIDAIGQAAIPHLEVLLTDERRTKAVARLTHELRVPVVTMRAATQAMMTELRDRGEEPSRFFSNDYFDDSWSYTELMRRLLHNADYFGLETLRLNPGTAPTFLMAEIIAPAVRQIKALVKERGFSTERIEYARFDQIPALWIDKNQLQQVVFNLLSNAIKYAFDDPRAFNVRISATRELGSYSLRFADTGVGIPLGCEGAIFEEEFRGPDLTGRNVAGQGLGLWIVRRVVEAHGGDVRVTKRHLPTEITIRLPHELSKRPPRESTMLEGKS